MKSKTIGFITLFLMALSTVSTAVAQDLPEGYSSDADLDGVWNYNILESNGEVLMRKNMSTWTYVPVATEEGGNIQLKFLAFYNEEPYFDVTFKLADGSVNRTIANMSNSQITIDLS